MRIPLFEGCCQNEAGHLAISRCEVTSRGAGISDGVVMINNELLEFKGGGKTECCGSFVKSLPKKAKNGEMKDVIIDRFCKHSGYLMCILSMGWF